MASGDDCLDGSGEAQKAAVKDSGNERTGGWALGAPRKGRKGGSQAAPPPLLPPSSAAPILTLHKKRHACLCFGFQGTDFHGLHSADCHSAEEAAVDVTHPTVADAVRAALLQSGAIAATNAWPLARTKWALASRTDKGVHAAGAAVSFAMETLDEQLVLPAGTANGTSGAPDADAAGDAISDAGASVDSSISGGRALSEPTERRWCLTDAEIERLNGMLPPTIRVFYCGYVRKSFHARDCASSRCYEYLLPRDALGETSVA